LQGSALTLDKNSSKMSFICCVILRDIDKTEMKFIENFMDLDFIKSNIEMHKVSACLTNLSDKFDHTTENQIKATTEFWLTRISRPSL